MVNNSINIFDHSLFAQKLKRAAKNFSDYDFLFAWGEAQILDRLSLVNREFDNVLIVGERVTQKFTLALKAEKIVHLQWCGAFPPATKNSVTATQECIPFAPDSFDLVISNLELHTINDLPGYLFQLKKTLKPDGLFIASMFGGETLTELRQSLLQAEMDLKGGISPRVLPFADKQDMGALLQRAGFSLPVVDSDTLTVTYENMFKLMHDLRGMGESNIILERSKTNPGKEFFMKTVKYYQDNFTEDDARIAASFEIIFLHGWAPHESQQKPLRPGSAEKNLSDVL